MEENKVSSEKDTEVVKKTRGRPKKNKEAEVVEEVVKTPEQSVEDEIAALKEEIRMLRELNAAKEAEAKKLLELSSRVLDTSVPAAHAEEKTVSVKCLELNTVAPAVIALKVRGRARSDSSIFTPIV